MDEVREWNASVIGGHPVETIVVVLEAVQGTFSGAAKELRARTPKGGPNPYVVAPMLLLNLAEAFHRFVENGRPAKSIDGPFGRFALDVVQAIGLPSHWIEGQIGPAVSDWKSRQNSSEKGPG